MSKDILFILHLTPPVHGSSVVGEQIKNSKILKNNFKSHFINLNTSTSMVDMGKYGIRKIIRLINIVLNVFSSLIIYKPKISYIAISVNGTGFYRDAFIVLLIKLFGVKTIFHLHNKGVHYKKNNYFDNFLYKLIFKNSDVIILSKYLYYDIKKYVKKNRTHICFNGVPKLGKVKKKLVKNKTVEILFLSNLIESKGVFILLEALNKIKLKGLKFNCVLVGGEGDIDLNVLNSKIKNFNLENSVKYVGKKYGKKKESLFLKADIFAFPTYYHNECLPLVLIEAMQFSLPIVSTNEGGISDIVEDNKTGFLVPKRDALILSEKLELLILNEKLRIKMGELGNKLYNKKFTQRHFEKRINSIFQSIIR